MENMQQQSMQAAMLKDIHNQRLGSLSSSSAASEKSKSHSDLSSIELGKFSSDQRIFNRAAVFGRLLYFDRTRHSKSSTIGDRP